MINSLSRTLLKLTSPGVPDIYQGNEVWNFSLVDPDNRRPVDYECRRGKLASLKEAKPEELWQNWPDGRIKMFLTQRLLNFRRKHVELFRSGNYLPITASGTFADCIVAFARELNGEWIAVIAPRLSSRIGFPPLGEKWKETVVDLPESLLLENARDILTERETHFEGRRLAMAAALPVLPFAAITNCSGGL
jgi:(1->4)-alpha-D-glucan 1-alpha-D-glucosylmutase